MTRAWRRWREKKRRSDGQRERNKREKEA